MIAREMGLEENFIETVRGSAQLHDVGKIGIEDRILKKPGALTPEEFDVMKTHTDQGANILRPVVQLKENDPWHRVTPRITGWPRVSSRA